MKSDVKLPAVWFTVYPQILEENHLRDKNGCKDNYFTGYTILKWKYLIFIDLYIYVNYSELESFSVPFRHLNSAAKK